LRRGGLTNCASLANEIVFRARLGLVRSAIRLADGFDLTSSDGYMKSGAHPQLLQALIRPSRKKSTVGRNIGKFPSSL
jgi:hypothetical protein